MFSCLSVLCRHPYPPFNIHYRYRFQAPDHQTYEISWISFNTEKLETFNWNYLDHYICTRGDTDFALAEVSLGLLLMTAELLRLEETSAIISQPWSDFQSVRSLCSSFLVSGRGPLFGGVVLDMRRLHIFYMLPPRSPSLGGL